MAPSAHGGGHGGGGHGGGGHGGAPAGGGYGVAHGGGERGYRFDLVKDFWEFYAEVMHFKKLIQAQIERAGFDPTMAGGAPPIDAEVVLQRLQALLDRQAVTVGRMGIDAEIAQHRDARYAMTALADDIFLQDMVGWPGRDVWRSNLLEYRMFRSHIAGERLFEMIDRLLLSRHHRDGELARIYLLVLAMGFKGGLRDPEQARELQGYGTRLFEFIYNRQPDFRDAEEGLIPQAYRHNLTGRPSHRQYLGLRGWGLALVVVAGFLVLSEILWLIAVGGTADLAHAALAAARPTVGSASTSIVMPAPAAAPAAEHAEGGEGAASGEGHGGGTPNSEASSSEAAGGESHGIPGEATLAPIEGHAKP